MSIIGKKPFVDEILDALSVAEIEILKGLVDNPGTPTVVAIFGNENLISNANKGVSHVRFKLDKLNNTILDGFLLYKDSDHCGLFVYNDNTGVMDEFKIDPVNFSYLMINEHLSAEEFRRCLDDYVEKEEQRDIPVITIAATQLVTYGTASSLIPYFTLSTTTAQQKILSETNSGIIKLDITAIASTLSLPVNVIWIKRNAINVLGGKTLIQYSFDNSGFEYENALTNPPYIWMRHTGTGGAIYESTTTKLLFVTMTNISPVTVYGRIIPSWTNADIGKFVGLNAQGHTAWLSAGGTKLYKHTLNGTMVNGIGDETTFNNLVIISNYEETVDSATKLETLLANCLSTQSGTLEQIGATYYLMAFNYTNRKFVAMYNNSVNTIGIDVPTSLVEGFTDTKVLL